MNTDIESAQVAAEATLEHLIRRRWLDDAAKPAREAKIRSIQYSSFVRQIIEETKRDITVSQVVRLMKRMADRIRERSRDQDPPIAEPEVEPLYRLVLRWREGDTTGDERSNPHVKAGMVRRALKWLAAKGLADEIGTAKDAFRIRSRFRLHVKDAVANIGPALAHVRDLAVGATT